MNIVWMPIKRPRSFTGVDRRITFDCITANIDADTPLSTVFELMSRGNFRHVPVVDDSGAPVGLVAVRHLVQYLAERYPAEVLAMAPDVHQVTAVDGG